MKHVLVLIAFFSMTSFSWACSSVMASTQVNIAYTEPVLTTNGQPLTNLSSTHIMIYNDADATILADITIPASSASGGGSIQETFDAVVAPGEMLTVQVKVSAVNAVGDESVIMEECVVVDLGAPQGVSNLSVGN